MDSILSGKKKYEYRKFRCREDVDKIIIYLTAPVEWVVDEMVVGEIVEDTLEVVWEMTKEYSSITKDSTMEEKRRRWPITWES